MPTPPESPTPTPWAVWCRHHGQRFLTEAEYVRQFSNPDALWACPICGGDADWDDDNYEKAMGVDPEE